MPDQTIMYPSTLPFLNLGWSMVSSDNVLRSQPERGPAKTRRKTTAKTKTYSGTIVLTSEQLGIFMDFVENTIADGALSFGFPDYITNTSRKARLLSYSVKQSSALSYDIAVKIEVLP